MAAYIPTLGTILVAIFTAAFGIYSYRQQKRADNENYVAQKEIDRKIEMRNLRRQAYEKYLTAYRKNTILWGNDPPRADNNEEVVKAEGEYWLTYSNLFQIASDPVILAVSEFHQCAWIEDPTASTEAVEQFRVLYADMIMAMRNDVSEKTNLSKNVIQDRLPFNFGLYFQDGEGAQSNRPD